MVVMCFAFVCVSLMDAQISKHHQLSRNILPAYPDSLYKERHSS